MKINQLTFFRFVAAILVVVFHFGRDIAPFNNDTTMMFLMKWNSLVSFFFLLSGFVLSVSSFNKPEIQKAKFYIARLARIYPLYLFALFIYFLPGLIDGNAFNNVSGKVLAMHLTLTQAFFADNALTLNYPGWSLSAEVFFYLSFPLVFSLLFKRSSKIVAIACSLFWAASMTAYALSISKFAINGNYTMYFPLYHFSTFVLGVGAGILFCRYKEVLNQARGVLMATTAGLAVVSVAAIMIPNPVIAYYHAGLFNPLFLSVILLFAIEKAPFKKILSARPLVFLGEISFGVYILQFSMWCLLYNSSGRFQMPILQNFWVCMAGLLVASAACYYLIEMPVVNLVKTLMSGNGKNAEPIILLPAGRHQQYWVPTAAS